MAIQTAKIDQAARVTLLCAFLDELGIPPMSK
jgi:hypothetical protein